MEAYIQAVSSYVPERRMSNDELALLVDTSDEWIYTHTGIRFRHIAAENEAASDLGIQAARRLMDQTGIDGDDIDLVLVATSTPDYVGLPSTACVVQNAIGAVHAGAMDLMAACTGFVYATETARNFVVAGAADRVLVIGAEVYSKILNWKDRTTCVLFGDGAGAALVSKSDKPESRILGSLLGSRGRDAESLLREAGGTRLPYDPDSMEEERLLLKMDGRRVYLFAVQAIGKTIHDLMHRYDLGIDDIAYVVPHQANVRIIDAAAKRVGLPREKFYMNIEEYANTSAASIPIALDEMNRKGLLARGDYILTVGFGSGLTYGGNVIRW